MIRTTESAQRRVLAALIFTFWCLYLGTRVPVTAPVFFGDKTVAIFDLWSCQHLLSGILFAAVFRNHRRMMFLLLIAAFSWEAAEWAMESGLAGATIGHWKAGHEFWLNRLLCDPLLAVIGAQISRRFRWAVWVAVPLTVAWCAVNVLAVDCMEVQRYVISIFTT